MALKDELLEMKGLLVHEKRLTWKGMKKMLVTIGVSRRMHNRKRPVPYFRDFGCAQTRSGTVYEGSLDYEHGPHGDDSEAENESRERMLNIVRIGYTSNPQYQTPVPFEEQETVSIADLDYLTLGRDEYDWTFDYPIPRDRSFARFEFLSSESSRGGSSHRRTTSTNAYGLYEQQPPLIQRLSNINTDRLYVYHDINTGMIFFSTLPANDQHLQTINTPI